jgi:hypothetical protein
LASAQAWGIAEPSRLGDRQRGVRELMTSIAALLLPFALMQAAETAPSAGASHVQQRFAACVQQIDADAERAYEDAMAWAAEAQSVYAFRCAAMALIGQNRNDEGARRLDSLGMALNPNRHRRCGPNSSAKRATRGCWRASRARARSFVHARHRDHGRRHRRSCRTS